MSTYVPVWGSDHAVTFDEKIVKPGNHVLLADQKGSPIFARFCLNRTGKFFLKG